MRDIELGKRQLPISSAHQIAWKTGAGIEWLLGNQLDIPLPEDLDRRMKDRTACIKLTKDDREESVDQIIRYTDDYPIRALEEICISAKKLGCREESAVGQLRWMSKLSKDLEMSLEKYEDEIEGLTKASPHLR